MEEIISAGRRVAVFMEKPLAGNHADAVKIVERTSKADLKTMVGFQKRFSPVFQKGKKILNEGTLGELSSFTAYSFCSSVFSQRKGWRFKQGQGGALLDLGPHLIDVILWYFGEPIEVEGETRSMYSNEVDDFATGNFKFESGLTGSCSVSWSVEGYRLPEMGIEIVGSGGKLKVTDDYLRLDLRGTANVSGRGCTYMKPEFDTSVDFLLGDPEYCAEDKYFINCIQNQRTPTPDFYAASKVNELIGRMTN